MGVVIFYICISLYLFGDLAIYGSAVPKSIRDAIWFVNTKKEFFPKQNFPFLDISVPLNQSIAQIVQFMIHVGEFLH